MNTTAPSSTSKPAKGKGKAAPPLSKGEEVALAMFIHHIRTKLKRPEVTTQEAAWILGCSRRQIALYLDAGVLPGGKLPDAKGRQRPRQPSLLLAGAELTKEEERDARHHRLPVAPVLLLKISEYIEAWGPVMKRNHELAMKLLTALLRFLPLPLLYSLRELVDGWITQRADDFRVTTGRTWKPVQQPDASEAEQLFFPDDGGLPGCDEQRY